MSIQTLKDTGPDYLIHNEYDGAVYRLASGDCICEGIGDEFVLGYNQSSLNVSVGTGQAVLCGNFFRMDEAENITLDASSTTYICLRIDTSKPNGFTGSVEKLTDAQIEYGNINGSDTVRDLPIYRVITSSNGITSVQDLRFVKATSNPPVLIGVLAAGQTSLTITSDQITTDCILDYYTSIYGVNPESAVINNGSVDLTFTEQATDMYVGVKIEGYF